MIEDGFYWVQCDTDQDLTIAELKNGEWWLIGCEDPWPPHDIHEIRARIECPAT